MNQNRAPPREAALNPAFKFQVSPLYYLPEATPLHKTQGDAMLTTWLQQPESQRRKSQLSVDVVDVARALNGTQLSSLSANQQKQVLLALLVYVGWVAQDSTLKIPEDV